MTKHSTDIRSFRTLALASAGIAALALGSPAFAQAPAASDTAADAGVTDIIVTAQRREESLQRVPLSIVAIGRDALKNADVTDVYRLQQIAPGLSLGRSGSDPRPAMRGIYTESIQGNADPRFGFYIDEVYQSRTSQLSIPFVDLERVEVQKGPQGTLYGRNSFGGNIAVTTAKPSDKLEGGVDILVGSYRRVVGDAFFNLPISDGLALRVAGYAEQRDGFVRSTVASPSADQDDKKQQFIRGTLRWAPPSMDGRLEVLLRGSYWNEDDNGNGAFNAKAIGQMIDPSLITAPGGTRVIGGATYNFFAGYNGRTFAGTVFYPYGTFRDGIPDVNGADIGYPVAGPYNVFNNAPSSQRIKSTAFSGTINFDISDSVRLRSITGYTDFSALRSTDNDGTPAEYGIGYFITKNKSFSQEVQLQSIDKSSPFTWTIGGYYLNDTVPDAFLGVRGRSYSTVGALAGAPGTGGYPLYFGSNFTYLPTNNVNVTTAPGTSSANIPAPASDAYNPISWAKTTSYAAYGQVSYTFAEKLTLTAGLRYTVETKDLRSAIQAGTTVDGNPGTQFPGAGTYFVFPITADFNTTCGGYTAADPSSTASAAAQAQALVTRCGYKTFRYATYRAAADYKVNDDVLLYASYSNGKHSGGFSYSPLPVAGASTALPPYDTETIDAFELGMKGSFFDRRVQVNIAAFYNLFTNIQVQTSFANPALANSVVTVAGNGAKAKAPGIDFQVVARPVERLTLSFNANYMRSRQDPYPVAVADNGFCAISRGGTCLTNPEVRYGFSGGITPNPFSNPELFVPILDANGNQVTVNVTSYDLAGNAVTLPAKQYRSLGYNRATRIQNVPDITISGGISYDFDLGGAGSLTPEVFTYFNGGYLLSPALVNFQQKSFTKTDLRLTWRSEDRRLSLQAFVENVEDNAVIGRVTVASGGGFSGSYQAPRTWGLKLGYKM